MAYQHPLRGTVTAQIGVSGRRDGVSEGRYLGSGLGWAVIRVRFGWGAQTCVLRGVCNGET